MVGTRFAELGVYINTIKELLAHSDIKTTMIYVHSVSADMEKAMNILTLILQNIKRIQNGHEYKIKNDGKEKNGRCGTRTHDPHNVNVMRYHLR